MQRETENTQRSQFQLADVALVAETEDAMPERT
jgi:hypothetical protein